MMDRRMARELDSFGEDQFKGMGPEEEEEQGEEEPILPADPDEANAAFEENEEEDDLEDLEDEDEYEGLDEEDNL